MRANSNLINTDDICNRIHRRCAPMVCLRICCICHPYLHFEGSHINYKIIDRIFRLICLIKYIALHTLTFRFAPCSCRAGALYACMPASPFASKLARTTCMQVCIACRNAQKKLPNKLESFMVCGREDSNSRHLGP